MRPHKMEAHKKEQERKAVMHERTKSRTREDYTYMRTMRNRKNQSEIREDIQADDT